MKPIDYAVAEDHKVNVSSARGIAAGTKVMTLDGEMPIEFLSEGDRVITRDTGMAVLKSIRSRKIACDVVHIAGGSLGHNRPDADITVPAGQELLIRDWRAEALFGKKQALIAAERLVDGEYVRSMGKGVMTVYELVFDTDHIIYAGGLEVVARSEHTLATAC